MNSHKNARLTASRRLRMIQVTAECCMSIVEVASAHGVTPPTASKWLGRYQAHGEQGLVGAPS